MHPVFRTAVIILVLCLVAGTVLAASIPVPGVGVVVKKHPGNCSARFGETGFPVPADFFGPGSEPFVGTVGLQGPCDLPCDPCNCDDLRLDYSMDSPAGPFDTELVAMTLHSVAPITVTGAGGVDSFFDIWVELRGTGGALAVGGSLAIEPGTALLPGASSFVVDSFFDIEYRIRFTEAGTTTPAGQEIVGSLRLDLQGTGLPIACLDDGGATGVIVLGRDDLGVHPFTFADSGGLLSLEMESDAEGVVGEQAGTWSALKVLYR